MVDSVLYLVLSWYISEVWPSKYGVTKPADFPFHRSYWMSSESTNAIDSYGDADGDGNGSATNSYFHQRRRNGAFTLLPTTGDDSADGIELHPVNNNNNNNITYNPLVNISSDNFNNSDNNNNNNQPNQPLPVITPESDTAHPSEPLDTDSVSVLSISVQGLRKTYDSKLVVNHVHLNIHENQIFVLLGHNGAGKVCIHTKL
jgi:ABC-type multidrug transport system fused ATPase/permease subunit